MTMTSLDKKALFSVFVTLALQASACALVWVQFDDGVGETASLGLWRWCISTRVSVNRCMTPNEFSKEFSGDVSVHGAVTSAEACAGLSILSMVLAALVVAHRLYANAAESRARAALIGKNTMVLTSIVSIVAVGVGFGGMTSNAKSFLDSLLFAESITTTPGPSLYLGISSFICACTSVLFFHALIGSRPLQPVSISTRNPLDGTSTTSRA